MSEYYLNQPINWLKVQIERLNQLFASFSKVELVIYSVLYFLFLETSNDL